MRGDPIRRAARPATATICTLRLGVDPERGRTGGNRVDRRPELDADAAAWLALILTDGALPIGRHKRGCVAKAPELDEPSGVSDKEHGGSVHGRTRRLPPLEPCPSIT